MAATENDRKAPPRDNLVRGVFPADIEVREATDDGGTTLFGHFSVFDQWSEIHSMFEGNFMERIAPGAFKKTIRENRDGMRVLLNHGHNPQLGDKPIGAIQELREDDFGAYYEADLFKSVPDIVMDGLRAKQYGASFRFRVMREEWVDDPDPSDANPRGLPERTIKEASVMEFGPVTWGQYPAATSGVRSLTDEFIASRTAAPDTTGTNATTTTTNVTFTAAPEGRTVNADDEPTDEATTAAPPHPDEPVRAEAPSPPHTNKEAGMNIEEMRAQRDELVRELAEIASANVGAMLDTPTQERWNQIVQERDALDNGIQATEQREAYLSSLAGDPNNLDVPESEQTRTNGGIGRPIAGTGTYAAARGNRDKLPDNVFDVGAYHGRARSQEHMQRLMQDGARRAIEGFRFRDGVDGARSAAHMEGLAMRSDGEVAQRVLLFGSPTYRAAFFKTLTKQPLTAEEQRAMAAGAALEARDMTTANTGGVTVPIQIDPTLMLTSNGALNPFREISRVVTTTSYIWQGVTTAGVTSQYRAEGTHMTDGTPTLVPRPIQPERADCFIPFSWEAGQDWTTLESDLGAVIQDSKDSLEATKFAVGAGHGSNEPQGVLIGAGTVVATSGGTAGTGFSAADVFALDAALPARYGGNETWVTSKAVISKIRQFDTSGGGLFWANLLPGTPETLIGSPIRTASTVGTSAIPTTAGGVWGIVGDFNRYVIVDRVGFGVRVIPDLFGGTAAVHYPTGQSGLVGYWRNSAGVVDSNAFRVGTVSRGFA